MQINHHVGRLLRDVNFTVRGENEIKIAYFNPVGIIVIHRFVKANESFFLKILTTDDGIVLIFEFKNLWVAEMIGSILWLINEDLVDFFEVSILV